MQWLCLMDSDVHQNQDSLHLKLSVCISSQPSIKRGFRRSNHSAECQCPGSRLPRSTPRDPGGGAKHSIRPVTVEFHCSERRTMIRCCSVEAHWSSTSMDFKGAETLRTRTRRKSDLRRKSFWFWMNSSQSFLLHFRQWHLNTSLREFASGTHMHACARTHATLLSSWSFHHDMHGDRALNWIFMWWRWTGRRSRCRRMRWRSGGGGGAEGGTGGGGAEGRGGARVGEGHTCQTCRCPFLVHCRCPSLGVYALSTHKCWMWVWMFFFAGKSLEAPSVSAVSCVSILGYGQ